MLSRLIARLQIISVRTLKLILFGICFIWIISFVWSNYLDSTSRRVSLRSWWASQWLRSPGSRSAAREDWTMAPADSARRPPTSLPTTNTQEWKKLASISSWNAIMTNRLNYSPILCLLGEYRFNIRFNGKSLTRFPWREREREKKNNTFRLWIYTKIL